MGSFFEKLKKGMGIEMPTEEKELEEKPPKEGPRLPTPVEERSSLRGTEGQAKLLQKKRRVKKLEVKSGPKPPEIKEAEPEKPAVKEKPSVAKAMDSIPLSTLPDSRRDSSGKEKWFEPEGQLAVDVYQTDGEMVIQSAIAGVKPDDLDISIERDKILIKGNREKPAEEGKINYFYQECYWGPFSKQIILPEETDPGRAEAVMKEGILTIRLPKIQREKKRKIIVKNS